MRDSIGAAARQNGCVKVQQRDRMKGAVVNYHAPKGTWLATPL